MSVTLHTDLGDLKLELFCKLCPKTCENFLALVASGKYDGTVFHRNIPGFIVQGGDPTGTGKGGESIWVRQRVSFCVLILNKGGPFEDEIDDNLRHSGRGILSMANSGANTNRVRANYLSMR